MPKTGPPGVSVIIPAYNYARYLPSAIDSVLVQTYSPVETIVVDDGSTDNTRDVVAAYGDRVRYLYQTNSGLSEARNAGVRAASQGYVAFLDADDVLVDTMLERLMAALTALDEGFSLIACGHAYIDANGERCAKVMKNPCPSGEVTLRDILLKDRFAADAVVVRREALLRVGGFDENLRSCEDRDLWIRLAQCGRLWRVADVLVHIRLHPGSMSANADRMVRNLRCVLRRSWASKCVPRREIGFWAQVFAVFFFQCAWMYYEAGRPVKAIGEMVKSVLVWPCFPRTRWLGEPPAFRLRSLLRFLLAAMH